MTEKKPLLTFALFAYNQEQYIEEAVLGAFSQTYSPLEIVLSDDCSPDNTFAIMEKMAKEYKGPHKIILNRNQKNLGLIGHINKVFLEIANGEIVVVAAGDDISLPERVKKTYLLFNKYPNIMSTTMEYSNIDSRGHNVQNRNKFCKQGKYKLKNYIRGEKIPIYGATRAYKKVIFEVFGPLSSKCHAEDVALNFRALILGEVWHQAEVNIFYRVQPISLATLGGSITAIKSISAQIKKDFDFALKRNIIKKADIKPLKNRINTNLIVANIKIGYKTTRFKTFYFFRYILLSAKIPIREKKIIFLSLLKDILPNEIIIILNKFRGSSFLFLYLIKVMVINVNSNF